MNKFIQSDFAIYLLLSLIALSYFLIVLYIIQNRKLRKKYIALMQGAEVNNIEAAILHLQNQMIQVKQDLTTQETTIEFIQEKMKHLKSHVYIHRYSAFTDETSGLSYSVVFLDEMMNGVVITGLYNREQSYTYAKPIEQGQSKYKLSPEEREAIQKTVENAFT